MKSYLTILLFLLQNFLFAQAKQYQIQTVAFYNFENLFDTINNPNTNDDEWTPSGKQNWNSEKYHQKLNNLATVISGIGKPQNSNAPALLGACEIENRSVLEDLVQNPLLKPFGYQIIHFDSPDKRGISVALLYQKDLFVPIRYSKIPLLIYKDNDSTKLENRIFTRDILYVHGKLNNEELHLLINHWPSRSGGEKKSQPLREKAAQLAKNTIDSISVQYPNAKIILMGDLNDGPYNDSVKKMLLAKKEKNIAVSETYNPFESLFYQGFGTIAHQDAWDIFDQIILNQNLVQSASGGFQFWKAGIFNKPFMIQQEGRYKCYPKRHSDNEVGFSDHFPVYIYLIKEAKF